MTQVYSKALNETISIDRIIGKIESQNKGPTVVFFGGIHGNEAAGVFSLKEVFNQINPKNVKGNIYGITGNLKALEKNQRFIVSDLNRIWTKQSVKDLKNKPPLNTEELEQIAIFNLLEEIFNNNEGPFYFIDLHTTSSKTLPFITINDALINRKFSRMFPVPIVLGIEEYLNGPLLSYINELGYVSLGFESGQHDEENAITNSLAFIYLALVYARVINEEDISDFDKYFNRLKTESQGATEIYEIIYLHRILNGEKFKMNPGFKSFQKISKGTVIGVNDEETIKSAYNAQIFMPLYQTKGKEGFFVIRKIKPIFLKLSAFLRKIKFDSLMVVLPGVSWQDKSIGALQVNLKVAKFMVKPLFHLLGYRNKDIDETHIRLYNRERVSKSNMYKKEMWYKKPC